MTPEDPLYDIFVRNTSASRKTAPVWQGFMRYFPRAMKAVAYLSWMGNQKHNPDAETLGWSWNRSNDHGDCVGRHQSEVGELDEYNLQHEIAVAWRAMAQLEVYLVEKYDLDLPPAAYLVGDDGEKIPEARSEGAYDVSLSPEAREILETAWCKAKRLDAVAGLFGAKSEADQSWQDYIDELIARDNQCTMQD